MKYGTKVDSRTKDSWNIGTSQGWTVETRYHILGNRVFFVCNRCVWKLFFRDKAYAAGIAIAAVGGSFAFVLLARVLGIIWEPLAWILLVLFAFVILPIALVMLQVSWEQVSTLSPSWHRGLVVLETLQSNEHHEDLTLLEASTLRL